MRILAAGGTAALPSALGRLRQEVCQPELHTETVSRKETRKWVSEFEASAGHTERPCLKNNKKTKSRWNRGRGLIDIVSRELGPQQASRTGGGDGHFLRTGVEKALRTLGDRILGSFAKA